MSQYTSFENYTDDELIKMGLASTPLAVELAQRLEAAGDNDDERIGELERANDQLKDWLSYLSAEIDELEERQAGRTDRRNDQRSCIGAKTMSLEQAVLANTAAIEKLTALLATNAVATLPEKPAEKLQPVTGGADTGKAPAGKKAKPEPKTEEPKAPTYEETAKALKELAAAKGRNAVMELLGKYGAEKTLQEVKTEKFAALVDDAKKAMA